MLHEPEFESPETAAAETVAKSSVMGRVVRGVFYTSLVAMLGLVVGVQASPQFAAAVGENVPEPVAAVMASMTGAETETACSDGKCCSSMSRASLISASTESDSACCSSEAGCPLEAAAFASAESGACCSSTSAVASAECTGECPLSAGSVAEDVAVALPAPPAAATDAETTEESEVADEAI